MVMPDPFDDPSTIHTSPAIVLARALELAATWATNEPNSEDADYAVMYLSAEVEKLSDHPALPALCAAILVTDQPWIIAGMILRAVGGRQ